ncbi:uncharacterized protein EV420DRAFT_930751 [Desarmillaria tabescens]|uniref:Uncharacterized protein n=1 Tax=Armillaria tabescens TaxID=1929756 RepID=A0AA39T4Y2_ARMTA|nr:uncharacterized protein EV420DRAFT_930751 [Desarmillaria tabescens]KAK0464966.1 hypothetical protein EV420DRAFT_930751 [Desarmillaria tabescens]
MPWERRPQRSTFQNTGQTSYSRMSRTPGFDNPEHFTQGKHSDWYCNICTPHPRPKYMNVKAALAHEKNAHHHQNVVNVESWWGPPIVDSWDFELPKQEEMTKDEARDSEHRYFVDHVGEYIPYWIRGVEAAERGEVLKLEDYLDSLDHDGPKDPWGTWGASRGGDHSSEWMHGAPSDDLGSMPTSQGKAGKSPKNTDRNKRQELGNRFTDGSYAFVEDIARQEEANAERREQMHDFFEMPTDKKVQRIDELIRSLHANLHT